MRERGSDPDATARHANTVCCVRTRGTTHQTDSDIRMDGISRRCEPQVERADVETAVPSSCTFVTC